MKFRKWPSIEKFSNVRQYITHFLPIQEFTFRSKIKLHGTNASITVTKDKFKAGKRTSYISVLNDNAGFAKFVDTLPFNTVEKYEDYIIYGEWTGPGVQKSDAVSSIPEKTFFVFSVYDSKNENNIYEPSEIETILNELNLNNHNNIKVIPWFNEETTLIIHSEEQSQKFYDKIVDDVDEIGELDPYIKSEYNIEGNGEGLVVYCTSSKNSQMMFKVKSDAHNVIKVKNKKSIDISLSEESKEFASMFFTENRFRQIYDEVYGDEKAEMKMLGSFIKAVVGDVSKECIIELENSPKVEWKHASSRGVQLIKEWFIKESSKI